MFTKLALAALAAAHVASAASSCSSDTFTVTAASDAAITTCTSVTGNVVISTDVGNSVDLGSIASIDGDLTVLNNGALVSFTADSLNQISGTTTFQNLTVLSTLSMKALETVNTLTLQSLPALNTLTFTAGVQSAGTVTISDTFLESLDGIELQTVGTMNINNNNRLTTCDLDLVNITEILSFQANGQKLAVTLDNLIWASNLTIANVTTFSTPSLEVVNGSMKFDSNYFTEYIAPNFTKTVSGDISFNNNADLTNLTLAALTDIGGGLSIQNNTALESPNFPKLADIGGAVKLLGSFTNVSFPSLHNVQGTFSVSSTEDISSDCTALKEEAPESQGGNGDIQGKLTCTFNNADANNGSTSGGSNGLGGSSNSSSSATGMHISSAVMGLSFVGLLAQLL